VFTGLVQALGRIGAIERSGDGARVTIETPLVSELSAGDSVAVNGVCLTAAARDGDTVTVDVMAETLRRTALGELHPGSPVNLELAVTPTTRLGGHLVQGHVDGVGRVVAREPGEAWDVVTVRLPAGLGRYVVEKGSLCLHGVSLTVVAVDGDVVTVSLIPETLRRTTWGTAPPGSAVNVEVDVLAKYVERLLAGRTVAAPTGGTLPSTPEGADR
jgi:riboflavin synthase